MTSDYLEIVRRESRPLEPEATGAVPKLASLDAIRAVMFDIYGTLLISASGDVGTLKEDGARGTSKADCLLAAFEAVGIRGCLDGAKAHEVWVAEIERAQAVSRAAGVDFPEVDIVAVWQATLDDVARHGAVDGTATEAWRSSTKCGRIVPGRCRVLTNFYTRFARRASPAALSATLNSSPPW